MCNVPICNFDGQNVAEMKVGQAQNTDLKDFAQRLRACRKRVGMKQADFAAAGGVGAVSQHRYESGATEPNASYLSNLASAGMDVIFILTGQHQSDALSPQAQELISIFERLDERDRAVLLATADALDGGGSASIARDREGAALHQPRPPFRAESD